MLFRSIKLDGNDDCAVDRFNSWQTEVCGLNFGYLVISAQLKDLKNPSAPDLDIVLQHRFYGIQGQKGVTKVYTEDSVNLQQQMVNGRPFVIDGDASIIDKYTLYELLEIKPNSDYSLTLTVAGRD